MASEGRTTNNEPEAATSHARDALPAVCFEWDMRTDRVERSGALEAITGYRLDEAEPTGQWWKALVHPDDMARLSLLAQEIRVGQVHHTSQYRIRHKQGHYVHVWEHALLQWDGHVPVRLAGTTINVSAFNKAEAELYKAKTMLERIVAAMPDLLYVFDLDETRAVYANHEVLRMLGYSEAQVQKLGANLIQPLHPDELAKTADRNSKRRQLSDDDVFAHELLLRNADGQDTWMRTREVAFTRNAAGEVTQVLGIAHDVTDEKRTAERLARSQQEAMSRASELERERHQIVQILQHMPSGVAVAQAPLGRISFVNTRAQEIWGKTASANSIGDYVQWRAFDEDGHELPPAQYPLARALRGETVSRAIVHFERGDGVRAISATSAGPIRDANGEITSAVAVFADVTEQFRAEKERELLRRALSKAEVRARRILECGVVGVLYWRLNGGVTYANDEFLRMVGYDRKDLDAGKLDWRAITPAEWQPVDAKAIEEIKATGVSSLFTKQYLRKDATRVDVLLGAALFDQEDDQGVTLCIDITPQRRLEEQLRRQLHFEKELLAIVSHDLRTPINVISLSAALARARTSDDRMAALLQRISGNADRLGRIVADLLDASEARMGGGIPLTLRPCSLTDVVADALENVRAQHPDREVLTSLSPSFMGMWDADRLGQVIQNLLANAIRYGDPARPITLRTSTHESMAIIEVHNFGRPIAPEFIEQIFQPFRTTERRRGRNSDGGLGLGLYIVHSIVAAHGGTVTASSTEAQGTSFVITLPREATAALQSA